VPKRPACYGTRQKQKMHERIRASFFYPLEYTTKGMHFVVYTITKSSSLIALAPILQYKLFFPSQSLDRRGNISDTTEEENYARKMMLNSAKTKVFLCDSEKFNTQSTYKLCNLNEIDRAVFDIPYLDLNTQCKML